MLPRAGLGWMGKGRGAGGRCRPPSLMVLAGAVNAPPSACAYFSLNKAVWLLPSLRLIVTL